jgi:hypothetical protein
MRRARMSLLPVVTCIAFVFMNAPAGAQASLAAKHSHHGQSAHRRNSPTHKRRHPRHHKHAGSGRPAPIPVDGPICRAWGISVPCRCPTTETAAPVPLPPGDGWVEITLLYPPSLEGYDSDSCPGGIWVESAGDRVVASAGYPRGPTQGGPGLRSGSVLVFALSPGTWKSTAVAGQTITGSETFSIVAGQATAVIFHLAGA